MFVEDSKSKEMLYQVTTHQETVLSPVARHFVKA
jgi:hypothetical protein